MLFLFAISFTLVSLYLLIFLSWYDNIFLEISSEVDLGIAGLNLNLNIDNLTIFFFFALSYVYISYTLYKKSYINKRSNVKRISIKKPLIPLNIVPYIKGVFFLSVALLFIVDSLLSIWVTLMVIIVSFVLHRNKSIYPYEILSSIIVNLFCSMVLLFSIVFLIVNFGIYSVSNIFDFANEIDLQNDSSNLTIAIITLVLSILSIMGVLSLFNVKRIQKLYDVYKLILFYCGIYIILRMLPLFAKWDFWYDFITYVGIAVLFCNLALFFIKCIPIELFNKVKISHRNISLWIFASLILLLISSPGAISIKLIFIILVLYAVAQFFEALLKFVGKGSIGFRLYLTLAFVLIFIAITPLPFSLTFISYYLSYELFIALEQTDYILSNLSIFAIIIIYSIYNYYWINLFWTNIKKHPKCLSLKLKNEIELNKQIAIVMISMTTLVILYFPILFSGSFNNILDEITRSIFPINVDFFFIDQTNISFEFFNILPIFIGVVLFILSVAVDYLFDKKFQVLTDSKIYPRKLNYIRDDREYMLIKYLAKIFVSFTKLLNNIIGDIRALFTIITIIIFLSLPGYFDLSWRWKNLSLDTFVSSALAIVLLSLLFLKHNKTIQFGLIFISFISMLIYYGYISISLILFMALIAIVPTFEKALITNQSHLYIQSSPKGFIMAKVKDLFDTLLSLLLVSSIFIPFIYIMQLDVDLSSGDNLITYLLVLPIGWVDMFWWFLIEVKILESFLVLMLGLAFTKYIKD